MTENTILETGRLRLGSWNARYGELLERHCNREEVMKNLGGPLNGDGHAALVRWLAGQQDDYGMTFWAVEHKPDGEFLGFCGLVKVDEPDSPVLGATEIGWRFRTDYQRKGLAKEAATACMHFAFEKNGDGVGFRNVCDGLRVVSRTTVANRPSWRLMEKLGMRHDPRLDYLPTEGGDALITHVMTYDRWSKVRKDLPDTRI